MSENTVGHTNASGNLFELIVGCEFGGIDDRVTHHVRTDTDPETFNAILLDGFLVAVHGASVWALCCRKLSLSLHSNLNEISGVGD